jgi:hypothetical protein
MNPRGKVGAEKVAERAWSERKSRHRGRKFGPEEISSESWRASLDTDRRNYDP